MKTVYFAYGSNMATDQMHSRISSAKVFGCARLNDKRLIFSKKSKDGSGKANLIDSLGDVTWGVLYEIESKDLVKLDRIERGYKRVSLKAYTRQGNPILVKTYISSALTERPVAYDWYKELLVSGACEHNLPKDYLDYLKQLPSRTDKSKSKWANQ